MLERDQELKKEKVQLFMQKNSSNVVYLWRVNKLVKQGLHLCHAFFDELGKAFGVLHEKIKKEQFYNWRVAGEKKCNHATSPKRGGRSTSSYNHMHFM